MLGIEVALTKLGLNEHDNKSQLMAFFISEGESLNPQTTAWCAAFVGACERKAGKKGTGMYNARSYLKYGEEIHFKDSHGNIDLANAREGDICIFDFEHDGVHGHVTYFVNIATDEEGNLRIKCLGGNQQDEVKYSYYPADSLIGLRRSS